jgi:hypothetical protein
MKKGGLQRILKMITQGSSMFIVNPQKALHPEGVMKARVTIRLTMEDVTNKPRISNVSVGAVLS